jgi:hypothetical protein
VGLRDHAGTRCALADTDEFERRASRVVLTPALALSAGLRTACAH